MGLFARGGGQQKEASSAPFYHNCNYHIAFLKEINDAARSYLPPHAWSLSHIHILILILSFRQHVGVYTNPQSHHKH